jgi:hypothetical protein
MGIRLKHCQWWQILSFHNSDLHFNRRSDQVVQVGQNDDPPLGYGQLAAIDQIWRLPEVAKRVPSPSIQQSQMLAHFSF